MSPTQYPSNVGGIHISPLNPPQSWSINQLRSRARRVHERKSGSDAGLGEGGKSACRLSQHHNLTHKRPPSEPCRASTLMQSPNPSLCPRSLPDSPQDPNGTTRLSPHQTLVAPIPDMSWKCPVLVLVSQFFGQNPYFPGHRFGPNNR